MSTMKLDYTKIKGLRDAFESLFNNELFSDIKFEFADGRVIFAHSLVLCSRSAEFCDSFKANIGVSKLIEVRNATYEEYFQFMKYLYTDSCQIEELNAPSMVEISKQHALPELETICVESIVQAMNIANACAILEKSMEMELENLRKISTEFITGNFFAALSAESFLNIKSETLKVILEFQPVSDNDEFKIFEFIMKWATQTCLNDGRQISGSLKRKILGDNFKLIRFGAMSAAEFGKCQELEPGLFTSDEIISLFLNLTTGKNDSFGFLNKKRELVWNSRVSDTVFIFDSDHWQRLSWCRPKDTCEISFSVSKPILIEQIYFATWLRSIRLENEGNKIIYEQNEETKFSEPIINQVLCANTRYTLHIIYNQHYQFLGPTDQDIEFKSKNENFTFTLHEMAYNCINYIKFKI